MLSLAVVATAWCRAGSSASCCTPGATAGSSGSPSASPRLGPATLFLSNKLYLDALYENVIVRAHRPARSPTAAYWINQNVIDGIVNGAGRAGRRVGGWFYRNIDQRVVDGAVNGSGYVATETGESLRPVQSGRVNQYGALLFGAAAIGAVVLVIVNV